MPPALNRRELLAGGGAALGCYLIGGARVWATPAAARARGFVPQALTRVQLQALEALAEALVPGSAQAGVGAFIDAQLAAGADSKLMAKYLGVPPERQAAFYRAAADGANAAVARDRQTAGAQTPLDATVLVAALAKDEVEGWQGPTGSFFVFLLRADALDVTYGTAAGFAALDIPYMAHIQPEAPW